MGFGTAASSPTLPPVPAASPTVVSSPQPTPSPTAQPSSRLVPALVDRSGIRPRLQAALDQGRLSIAAPGVGASVLFPAGHQWTGVSGRGGLATKRPPAAPMLTGVLVGGSPIDPRITVRQLLTHTSGLRDYLIDPRLDAAVRANLGAVWTMARALAYAGKPWSAPGVGYHYSNTNFVLLGLIAEHLTGRTLAEEYRDRFFGPLGLTTATYQGVEPPTSKMPTAYAFNSYALTATPVAMTDGTGIRPFTAITTAAGPAGSVAASASDLARWARALYGGSVLSPDAVAMMVGQAAATATLKPGFPYGLGVQVLTIDGRLSYGHSGRFIGSRAVMRWFPNEGIAIVIQMNDSRFDPTPILRSLLAIVAPRSVVAGLGAQ